MILLIMDQKPTQLEPILLKKNNNLIQIFFYLRFLNYRFTKKKNNSACYNFISQIT